MKKRLACEVVIVTLRAVIFAAPLLIGEVLTAATLPTKGTVDGRIRTAPYKADDVYRLYGFVGYAIELIFEEGETFAGNGGGDLEAVTFGWHDNHLILKPKAASVGTNLVIYTSRRAYRFEYSVSPRRPSQESDDVMFAVRFVYPPPESPQGLTSEQQADSELARAGANRHRNYDFWFCGAPAIKPIAVSDDGIHTRLTFGAKGELPAIFTRNDDGSESLLNFSIAEGDVVIHRVAPRFILRRGALTACIVNKGFVGSGERLDSGTVAPDVQRLRKGSQP